VGSNARPGAEYDRPHTASRYKYEAYKEFGADDYLAKPLEMGEIQAVLRKRLA
jgi:ActR/RegA family two-component response regulator